MLSFSQKYWIHFDSLYVRCSLEMAYTLYSPPKNGDSNKANLDPEAIRKDINNLSTSKKTKKLLADQVIAYIEAAKEHEENIPILENMSFAFIAYPNEHDNIMALMELENDEHYTIFYDVDEPVGHSLTEEELDEDLPPEITLEKVRKESWKFIQATHPEENRAPMPPYPDKKHGEDWLEIGSDPEPKPYWSEKTLEAISRLFYQHDFFHLAPNAPKDEYIGWAEQLQKRLELERELQTKFPNLPEDSPCFKFNKYQLAEQIARVVDFFFNLEGSVIPFYRRMEVVKYSEPRLMPSPRNDYLEMAEELYNILYEEE